MRFFLAGVALLAAGCTPLTERQRDVREYNQVEAEQQYFEYQAKCAAKGGVIFVDSWRGRAGRSESPGRSDRYRCI